MMPLVQVQASGRDTADDYFKEVVRLVLATLSAKGFEVTNRDLIFSPLSREEAGGNQNTVIVQMNEYGSRACQIFTVITSTVIEMGRVTKMLVPASRQ
jgi:hypothetical protein